MNIDLRILTILLLLVFTSGATAADSKSRPGEPGYVNEAGHVLVGIGVDFDPNDPKAKALVKKHKDRINKERKEKTANLKKENKI